MAAEEDGEEPQQVEQQGDHRAEMMAGSDRQINHFAGGWSFGEGQVAGANMARIDARVHRFDAFPLPSQTEPGDIVAERPMPIPVTEGRGELLKIRAEPSGAGARVVGQTSKLPAYP